MRIKYDIIGNPQKLEQETSGINERFRILYADGVVFEFFDIMSQTAWQYEEINGEPVQIQGSDVTTYSKLTAWEDVIVDDEVVGKNPIYTDYTAEFQDIRARLDAIIDGHPSPDPNPNLTLEERMDQIELVFLQSEGVI